MEPVRLRGCTKQAERCSQRGAAPGEIALTCALRTRFMLGRQKCVVLKVRSAGYCW